MEFKTVRIETYTSRFGGKVLTDENRHDGDVNSFKAVNSMAAAMELGGVVEGGLKLDASRW